MLRTSMIAADLRRSTVAYGRERRSSFLGHCLTLVCSTTLPAPR
jgi:hypothetical protein